MIFVNQLPISQNIYLPLFSIDDVQSDLLHKYQSKDDILILTVRLAVIVAVILTVPVLFFTVSKKLHTAWKLATAAEGAFLQTTAHQLTTPCCGSYKKSSSLDQSFPTLDFH